MSTRSRIGMKLPSGQIKSIYCHWDGYPEGVGKVLKQNYNSRIKIGKLLELGDISSLGPLVSSTISYKERGEDCPPRIDTDEEEFINKLGKCCEEWGYLYKPDYDGIDKWFYIEEPYFKELDNKTVGEQDGE